MMPYKSAKNWRQRSWPPGIDAKSCRSIASQLQLPLLITEILLQRGLSDVEQIETFLNPSLQQLPSPFCMKGMNRAVNLITEAVTNGIPITVYGDYDVDGVTGTAILMLFLKTLGAQVSYYQPNRLTEGYGLNKNAIKKLFDCNYSPEIGGLLITVDCGISDAVAVREAKRCGFLVIITDHHKPPPTLPSADTILNPLQPGCTFPFKSLAGVGVAFYLIMGVRKHLHAQGFWQAKEVPNLKAYLDLVALGTVSDLVPLQGINRIFVKAGLEVMRSNQRPGIKNLLEVAKLTGRKLAAEDIAYRLGPRINAAGRLGKTCKAVELLTTESDKLARQLTNELELANMERKSLQEQLVNDTLDLAENAINAGRMSLVLSGKDWHPGIIGIVATRLTEKYFRPAIVLSINNDGQVKGSGRSIPELNLYKTLSACADLLDGYGGHDRAAGMSLKIEHIEIFREKFENIVSERLCPEDLEPKLTFDSRITFEELFDKDFLNNYERLSPFGNGNPEPVFTSSKTKLVNSRTVGNGHLKFFLKKNGVMRQGIGFGFGYLRPELEQSKAELAVNLRSNEFRGERRWELNLIDLTISPST